MKTIIAGGRDHIFSRLDFELLDQYRIMLPITEVVSGAAMGADYLGELWSRSRGLPLTKKVPDLMGGAIPFWQAAKARNQEMADYADALVAFPGGGGTADMIRRAVEKKLVVIIVKDVKESLQQTLGVVRQGE